MFRFILTAIICGGAAVLGLTLTPHAPSTEVFATSYENVLGTSMDLRVQANSADTAARVEAAVLASVARDATVLSAYDPASEFSRWFATRDVATTVSPELAEVLAAFDAWRARTGGALDPAAERVSRAWKSAAAESRVPTGSELAAAVADTRRVHYRVNLATHQATHLSDTPLMLNSFTKSYIVDRAANAGLAAGASGVVVNIGGDIVVRGDMVETVAVRDPAASADNAAPLTSLLTSNRAVATSGGYRRGFDIGGRHYSHIVDPRTGQPAGHVQSATVVAENAINAGALATAMCVLTPEQSEAVAAGLGGVEFLLVLADGRQIESAGWRSLEAPRARGFSLPSPVATLEAAEQTWDPTYELTVAFEIARASGFGGKRPYVAVWVEDKDRFPVKTLALWFEKSRWLPDLRGWYRGDRLRALAEGTNIVASVSSATRSPGKYTLTWDGKDQSGKLVKPGPYTVAIEAAREHGTYQIIRQAIDLSAAPAHVDLAGNVEIASASLDYHKVAGR